MSATILSGPGWGRWRVPRRSPATTSWRQWTRLGLTGHLLVSPFSMYRYDASYALEVYAKHPGRFALIKPFDPHSDTVADEMAEWAATPGVVGARLMLTREPFEADDPGLHRVLAAGAQTGLPVNVLCWGLVPLFRELARQHPNTQVGG